LERIDSKVHLQALMRKKGSHDPNRELPRQLEYVAHAPSDSLFFFGDYRDKSGPFGPMAVILIPNSQTKENE
jgi:hypothetical protein